jgi:hypothetical protein
MIDGGDDKAGIGKRLGDIVMADEVAASAVRNDDEWSLSPRIVQSLTPEMAMLPRSISRGGSEQGYQIAPLRAGPSASAGTSTKRKPAACAGIAASERAIATRKLPARAKAVGNAPVHPRLGRVTEPRDQAGRALHMAIEGLGQLVACHTRL